MADLKALNATITKAISEARGDVPALEGIVAVLLAMAGIGIAHATKGRPLETALLCDLCEIGLAEQTAMAAQWVNAQDAMEDRHG